MSRTATHGCIEAIAKVLGHEHSRRYIRSMLDWNGYIAIENVFRFKIHLNAWNGAYCRCLSTTHISNILDTYAIMVICVRTVVFIHILSFLYLFMHIVLNLSQKKNYTRTTICIWFCRSTSRAPSFVRRIIRRYTNIHTYTYIYGCMQ